MIFMEKKPRNIVHETVAHLVGENPGTVYISTADDCQKKEYVGGVPEGFTLTALTKRNVVDMRATATA